MIEADHAAAIHRADAARERRQPEGDRVVGRPAGCRGRVRVADHSTRCARGVGDGLRSGARQEAHFYGLPLIPCVKSGRGVVVGVSCLRARDEAGRVADDRQLVPDDGANVRRAGPEDDRVARTTAGCAECDRCPDPWRRAGDLGDRHRLRAPYDHGLLHLRCGQVIPVAGLICVDEAAPVILEAHDSPAHRADAGRRGIDRERAGIAASAAAGSRCVGLAAAVRWRRRGRGEGDRLRGLRNVHGLLDLRCRVVVRIAGPVDIDDAGTGVAVEQDVRHAVDAAAARRGGIDRPGDRGPGVERAGGHRRLVIRRGSVDGIGGWRRGCECDRLIGLADDDRLLHLRRLAVVDRADLVGVDHAGADMVEGDDARCEGADAARRVVDGEGDGLTRSAAGGRGRVHRVDDG